MDDIDKKILSRFGSSTPKKRKKLPSTKFKIGDIVIIHNRFSDLNNTISRLGALELPIPRSKSIEDVVLPQVEDIVTALLDISK